MVNTAIKMVELVLRMVKFAKDSAFDIILFSMDKFVDS